MPSFFCIAAQHQLSKLQGTKAYTTVDHLSTKQIEEAIVPLPPLAEQKRIVAKVDELMALCDRLEAQLKERDVKQAVLAKAALAKFTEDPTPENLQLLFHPSYTIEPEDMRSCVRSLAVLGELTSNLNAEKRLGWQPSPLGILCAFLNGDRSKNYPSKNTRVVSGVPFINAGHLSDGDVATDDMDYITEEHFNRLGGGKVQKGDVLYCLRGSLGKCAVVSSIERGAVASSLVILRPGSKLDANYLHLYLCSPAGRTLISKYDNGSAQPNLSAANVKKYLIELPPIEEQRRIVIRAKELISLVDELEAQIGASRTTGEKLLEAMVAELTAD
jgi:type I restriction enzyme S subunit